jgi:hypothetical protein
MEFLLSTQNWEMIRLLIEVRVYYKEKLSEEKTGSYQKSFREGSGDSEMFRERPLTVGDFTEIILDSVPKSMMKELAGRLMKNCTELFVALQDNIDYKWTIAMLRKFHMTDLTIDMIGNREISEDNKLKWLLESFKYTMYSEQMEKTIRLWDLYHHKIDTQDDHL